MIPDINPDHLTHYGRDKAKVSLKALENRSQTGKLVLVSAITPTPAGEGKTTMSIGLTQGLKRIGKSTALALRQPSMGPVFGRKGGATGGGASTIQPADSINLHFTGDFHAITSAHNLLASALDNAVYYKKLNLAATGAHWKRVLDVNDRALRSVVTGLGTRAERESGFDITAASEIMAALCLSESAADLRERLDRMVLGVDRDGAPVFARRLGVTGALAALLRDAIEPNLVSSVEGVPAFVHGGPFANIAHGCNSVLATRMALAHADIAVTEAGFAFDLGGEKFFNIKCRQSGLRPSLIVIVATVRALKMHGGTDLGEMETPDPEAVRRGLVNLEAHLDAAAKFGPPTLVALNRFASDSDEEIAVIADACAARGVRFAAADVFSQGGAGAEVLANLVAEALEEPDAEITFTYDDDDAFETKVEKIATKVYGAKNVIFTDQAKSRIGLFRGQNLAHLPVCMAKTQNSLTDNPELRGRPTDFSITVRDVELANGAGFLVALTGDMMRMPALPKAPAAERIDLTPDGEITGI